jgi:hypothetical protein
MSGRPRSQSTWRGDADRCHRAGRPSFAIMPTASHRWEADGGIIAQGGDRFQCHVAAALDRPLIVLFEQNCADRRVIASSFGNDADHFGSALDLAVDAFERVGRVQLGAVYSCNPDMPHRDRTGCFIGRFSKRHFRDRILHAQPCSRSPTREELLQRLRSGRSLFSTYGRRNGDAKSVCTGRAADRGECTY